MVIATVIQYAFDIVNHALTKNNRSSYTGKTVLSEQQQLLSCSVRISLFKRSVKRSHTKDWLEKDETGELGVLLGSGWKNGWD
ncbi:hypothetical protein TNCV_1615191 [Trichonephila clavipes]|nr:hypothetical protein TNCV_1615191 [Trichonephila clavipes]